MSCMTPNAVGRRSVLFLCVLQAGIGFEPSSKKVIVACRLPSRYL